MSGIVQGVGFRPFVYKLAKSIGISGYVRNIGGQVEIVIEASKKESFLTMLKDNIPLGACIERIDLIPLKKVRMLEDFKILSSKINLVRFEDTLPRDIAICQDCLKEIDNSNCRHYLYPFNACTKCGPRYSIIDSLPYDRTRTSMRDFTMCLQCESEYSNPQNRRFHAQAISCPKCCISLKFYYKDLNGCLIEENTSKSDEEVLKMCVQAIKNGKIIAVKGIGGFSLVCDGRNDESILRLRERKNRSKKPFALMVKNVSMALKIADLNFTELKSLKSCVAPIVLANKLSYPKVPISDYIAPNIDTIGIILPYSGLHYLLLKMLNFPVVFTSANLNGDPIIGDFMEIKEKIGNIVDGVLDHNRTITNPIDDSVMRFLAGDMRVIRLGRGLAPLNLSLYNKTCNTPKKEPKTFIIAMGAEEKANLSYAEKLIGKKSQIQGQGGNFLISPYIGDLKTPATITRYEKNLDFFAQIYSIKINAFISDLHSNYQSTILSAKKSLEHRCSHYKVQHHQAHFYAGLAEVMLQNSLYTLDDEILGIIWDGTGLGDDGKIWGGEFFLGNFYKLRRIGHFREFDLLGAEVAIKKIIRIGYALALECGANKLAQNIEKKLAQEGLIIKKMFKKQINTIKTTSVGRIFDAVASLCGMLEKSDYEGEAGMLIEKFARKAKKMGLVKANEAYDFILKSQNQDSLKNYNNINNNLKNDFEIDLAPMILQMEEELTREAQNMSEYSEKAISIVAAKFIHTLAKIALRVSRRFSNNCVVFSGGVFQNRLLCEEIKYIFEINNIQFYMHKFTPPNDGCISFGQAVAFVHKGFKNEEKNDK